MVGWEMAANGLIACGEEFSEKGPFDERQVLMDFRS